MWNTVQKTAASIRAWAQACIAREAAKVRNGADFRRGFRYSFALGLLAKSGVDSPQGATESRGHTAYFPGRETYIVLSNSAITPRWYAIQTKPRQEEVAHLNLERQGFRVYLPRIQLKKRRGSKWQVVIEPLFPGYLFLNVDLDRDNIAPVRSTIGVRAMVRFGVERVPVPDEVIEYLQRREAAAGAASDESPNPFKPGDKVRILSGPFGGLEAVYEMDRSDDRVLLLIDMLGRQSRVKVAVDDVAPAEL